MPEDQVMKEGRWKFDEEVTEVFDNMLERSIPQFETMRDAVHSIIGKFATVTGTVVDLGCSRGGAIARSASEHPECRFLGVECSEPMFTAARERFQNQRNVTIVNMDLRSEYPKHVCSVVSSILCAMFVPIEYRMQLFHKAFEHLLPGGAFVLVEKVLGADAVLDHIMVDTYLEYKRSMGYTQEQIDRKRLNLEGVLVPVTARMNEEFLRAAGFQRVDCFWRWMNFAGWVAVKG